MKYDGQLLEEFGSRTTDAVIKFQTKYGVDLVSGGNVGIGLVRSATRAVLNNILKSLH